VDQVVKNPGLVLVLCLITLWLQLFAGLWLFIDDPLNLSMVVLLAMLFSGVLFSLLIGFAIQLLTNRQLRTPAWFQQMANGLAYRHELSGLDAHIVSTEGINAFAVDNMLGKRYIIVHHQVLRSLTHDEVEAILAHEICHIALRHAGVLTFLQGAMLLFSLPPALLLSSIVSLLMRRAVMLQMLFRLNSILSLILFPMTSVYLIVISRVWEYEADACAARLIGKQQYLHTLRCLHGSFFQHPNLLNLMGHTTVKAHGRKQQRGGLSHPSLAQRINALSEIGL
jgi:heat shock protein HtpX